jgi:hypothetical protein
MTPYFNAEAQRTRRFAEAERGAILLFGSEFFCGPCPPFSGCLLPKTGKNCPLTGRLEFGSVASC